MSDQVGRSLILHTVPFPAESDEVDRFMMVTIAETREVPGTWDQSKTHPGWRAIGENNKSFYCNWEVFPDDSMTPAWSWADEEGKAWYDVCQGIYQPIPFKPWFVDRYYAVIHYCEKHRRLDYFRDSEAWRKMCEEDGHDPNNPCFDCMMGKPAYEETQKGWKGWR